MAVRAEEIPVPRGRPGLVARVRGLLDREEILGPVFVTPALLLLLLLVAYPFVMALYFSMSNAFIGSPTHFFSLTNFVTPSTRDAFRHTFHNSFGFTGSAGAFPIGIATVPSLLPNAQLWA